MKKILEDLKIRAKQNPKRIVFPEGSDLRVLRAARIICDEKIGTPVILQGASAKELLKAENISSEGFEIIDNLDKEEYVQLLLKKRAHKGVDEAQARLLVEDVNYLGVLMVESGFADCMISGAIHPTAATIKPALQIIKTKDGIKTASSFFMMSKDDKTYFFSDCAFVINPSSAELCDIALSTASSTRALGFIPRVALLSFSTKGSAKDASIDKVTDALSKIKMREPELIVDGEMQFDSAIMSAVAKLKCPNSVIQGDANVLIFPDLNSGNIGYKIAERLGGFQAIGPIVQGLRKPINDLSRGCSVDDIVNVAIISVVEAQE